MFQRRLFAFLFMLFGPVLSSAGSNASAEADRLLMENGSILIGTLISADEAQVVFETPFAGKIVIRQENIKTIVTESEVDLLMQDGRLYHNRRIVSENEEMVVVSTNDETITFDVPDIKMVNPEPWRIGDGYRWTGNLSTAIESERGNSDTDELDAMGQTIWRSLVDRYTLRGNWEIDKTDDVRNKYLWMVQGKYDRFFSGDPDNYYGAQLMFEHDEFADLDLRTTFGPYVGRQFYETALLELHAEIGVVYVDEQFKVAEDDDYYGASWEVRLGFEPLAGLRLYANQDGIINFRNSDQLIANSTIGLQFPTLFGFTTAAEAVYEYDGGAVEGVDDTDETYRFKIGYSW